MSERLTFSEDTVTMDKERDRLYREFLEASAKRKVAYAEYERLNRRWYSVFSIKAHRSFNALIDALDAQNTAHERLNDYVEERLRSHAKEVE